MQGIAVAVDVGTGGEVVLLFEAGNFKGEGEGDGDSNGASIVTVFV
jgi:hypothetical protein